MKLTEKLISLMLAGVLLFGVCFTGAFGASAAAKVKNQEQKQQYNAVHGVGFNFDGKYFIYSNKGALYRSKSPYKEGKKIFKGLPAIVHCIQVYDGRVYFVDTAKTQLNSCNMNGNGLTTVIDFDGEFGMEQTNGSDSARFFIHKDKIYFTLDNVLYVTNLDGTKRKKIDSNVGPFHYFIKGKLYYVKGYKYLKAYDPATKKKKKLKKFKKETHLLSVEGNKLYFTGNYKYDDEKVTWNHTVYCYNVKKNSYKKVCHYIIQGDKKKKRYAYGQIIKDGKIYMSTDIKNSDRFAEVVIKKNKLNYDKFTKKYKYLGGHDNAVTKCTMGYFKNNIIGTEYKTKKNAGKNKIASFVKLVK